MKAKVLAALALGCFIVPAGVAQETGRPAIQFKAFCTFEREGAQLDLSNVKDASEVLSRHAYAHGWSWDVEAPDLVNGANAARCPSQVLDQMAQVSALSMEDSGIFLYRDLALALDRNESSDRALDLLKRALEGLAPKVKEELFDRHDTYAAFLSEWAAKVAAHSGDWTKALEFAEGWHSTSGCGNCAATEQSSIDAFTARCLVAAGRFDEARNLARRKSQSSWTTTGSLIEAWLECEIRDGRAKSVDDALSNILSMVPGDMRDDCKRARDDWELARAPKSTQLERLNELANAHPELALPLLLTLDKAQLSDQLRALNVEKGYVRDPALASLLVELGLPEVGIRLDNFKKMYDLKGGENPTEYLLDQWKQFNIRWKLLAGAG